MKVFILANGGKNIGMGHIMRTMVIAKKMLQKMEVQYVVSKKNEFEDGKLKIYNDGLEYIYEEDLVYKIQEKDILIIDRYDVNEKYIENLKKKNIFIILFDDNNRLKEYPVQIVLNQNLYAKEMKYKLGKETEFLLGSKYILLRQEFLSYKGIKINEEIQNMMVTVGGSDNKNITEKILEKIKRNKFKIHVIIGNAFKNSMVLREKFKKNENIIFYQNANMPEIMEKMDLCISACGSTIYELCFLGIPTLALIIAENQKDLSNHLNEKNIAIISNIENISRELEELTFEKRKCLNKNMKKIIDGKGCERVIKKIWEIVDKENSIKT